MNRKHTFGKAERLCSHKVIEALFAGGNKSFSAYPIRAIYMPMSVVRSADEGEPEKHNHVVKDQTACAKGENTSCTKGEKAAVQLLISVSKRHFKHAVDRNRVKRQIREAYRKHKQLLLDALPQAQSMAVAFIWLSDEHFDTAMIEERVRKLLVRLAETQCTERP
ncbi:MAG: ribonuclease P protein component [Bacteroidaceae bacterium]|nr:ribonuclease P protein component [Bacteroidaceae bacterium]